jgi:hypothetical protein
MLVLHITVVATNELHPLQLTAEIVASKSRDATKSWLFYADLVKLLNLSIPLTLLKLYALISFNKTFLRGSLS